MERITINNADELKAFIEAQKVARQHACATFIASRANLRYAPAAIQFYEFHREALKRAFTSCVIWRPLLMSAVSATVASDDIKGAALAAVKAADAAFATVKAADAVFAAATAAARASNAAFATAFAVTATVIAADADIT